MIFYSNSPVQITLFDVFALDVVMKLSVHTLAPALHVSRHHLIEAQLGPVILTNSISPRAL